MESPEIFVAFGAVMFVIALLAVAIDWFGKPLRHRKFVPKIYRFPEERQPRRSKVRETPWSDTPFVLPVVEARPEPMVLRYPDAAANGTPSAQRALAPADPGPPTAQVPPAELDMAEGADLSPIPDLVTLEDLDRAEASSIGGDPPVDSDEPSGRSADDPRGNGWKPGDYVFNLTAAGVEPTAATVRNRYWKNVASTAGAVVFGKANVDRMAEGNAPQRRNPRTGQLESMRLPKADFADTGGETPMPEWPSSEIDPFAAAPPEAPDE